MRACPTCGRSYEDDVAFCPEDGVSLPEADSLIGRTVGSYKVMKLLGKGGMGAVYLGQHPKIGSKVAIKFLHPRFSHDERAVMRFFNEARAVNMVGHDNIVRVVDLATTEEGRHYLVMELLEGDSLDVMVQRDGALPLPLIAQIVVQCCEALHWAHEIGIIHRDLKPENIFVLDKGYGRKSVKLVDFGIAKLNQPVPGVMRTGAGMVMGTPAYMSPEQALGEKVDRRTDVYSLGIILFEMATGQLPFADLDIGRLMVAQVKSEPPKPRDLNPAIPQALEDVILRALEKHRDDRFQNMDELRTALAQALGLKLDPIPPVPPVQIDLEQTDAGGDMPMLQGTGFNELVTRSDGSGGSTILEAPPPRSSRRWLMAAALASPLLLIAVVFLFARRNEDPRQPLARRAPAAKAPQKKDAERVKLVVSSNPTGAFVLAHWAGGFAQGQTPLELDVPQDSVVKLEWKREGYVAGLRELVAERAQAVMLDLQQMPNAAARPAAKRGKVSAADADLALPTGPAKPIPGIDDGPKKPKPKMVEQQRGRPEDEAVVGEEIFDSAEEL